MNFGSKTPNGCIRCNVNSCSFHCDNEECCSLTSICVEPCKNCGDGCADSESFCGSYRAK